MTSHTARVLLVEDNELDVRLIMRTAEETKLANSFEVIRSGSEALDMLRARAETDQKALPDLVMLDLSLPGIGGHEVLREIKAHPGLKHIPVVVLTSSAAESDVRAAYDEHAAGYVTKPVGIDGFLEVVKAIEGFFIEIVTLAPAP